MTKSAGLAFDGVAVAALSERTALFAWSSTEGLFAKRADRAPVRVGERCRGGLDLEASPGGVYLACSRPAADHGEVVFYRLDQGLGTRALHALGPAGRDGHGVALALRGSEAYVAFHDGSIGEHAVKLAHLQGGALSLTRVSHAGTAASEPTLVVHRGRPYLAFSELVLPSNGAQGEATGTVWLARAGEPPHELVRTRVAEPAPSLTTDALGLLLGYRDRKRGAARSELHVVRLDEHAKQQGAAQVIGRANAEGPPSVHGCKAFTAALLPREYGSERFIAINELDHRLSSVGAGHQFYTSGRDFVLASGACLGRSLLMLATDRASPGKPGVEALALRFHCRD